ncbi:MAG: UDP-N-acetylmuramoyl-L-alanine--D-glutamate ligase [Anaerolineae bacterium]|nr:UDP-N-acetylmuramoyl-L-alanine--D-glutamate ligase [Anaerolineae bacterium]
MMTDWKGRRVLILGAARQGQALARWLTKHGAHVTLSDIRSETELEPARQSLAGFPINWITSGHPLALLDDTDVLCISGGIPLTIPIIVEAQKRGIPLSNDTQIFMEVTPCRTVGITGSSGKTTTTALVADMAKTAKSRLDSGSPPNGNSSSSLNRPPSVFVGGNIGDPLINYVDDMRPNDLAILEISSFQLDQMSISPNIASILNITPNHLDRHGTMEAYTAAKERILSYQSKDDVAILGRDDPGAWDLREHVNGKLYSFGFSDLPKEHSGMVVSEGSYYLRDGAKYMQLPVQDTIHLRGDHNRLNILAAIIIGYAAGLTLNTMVEAIDNFHGIPHRLEFVREMGGVKWFNDSTATTPERTQAAIRSFDEPIILMLGGKDKDLAWDKLAELIRERVDHVVVFGEAAEKILSAIGNPGSGKKRPFSLQRSEELQDAIRQAAEMAASGDVVLLSPGGTSFDQFSDFANRGDCFKKWVQELS